MKWALDKWIRYDDSEHPIRFRVNVHNEGFPTNYVSTTKYNVFTFLPLNLFEQFRRISNFYFLLNVIVSCVPGISPMSPATTIAPLVFVLSVAALKDGVEDIYRWREDRKANSRSYQVVKDGQMQTIKSADLRVGDIVKLSKDEGIPADLIFLSSSHEDSECYIETANLDGETNLKTKQALTCTSKLTTLATLIQDPITVTADPSNASLVQWEGTIEIQGLKRPLELRQFLFRGCVLRNTDWVFGTVCYAGRDSKLMRNLKERPQKMSLMDKKLNKYIIAIFVLNFILCAMMATMATAFKNTVTQWAWYLKAYDQMDGDAWLGHFLTYCSLLSYMIPISVFVTIEICKAAQAKLMEFDDGMCHEGKRMKVKTSNLNEDLGQLHHIFTDKTGTLTDNVMNFACCRVLAIQHDEQKCPGGFLHQAQSPHSTNVSVRSYGHAILDFIRCILLCNTCVISRQDDGTLIPESSSQDEVALVKGMMANNCLLLERTSQHIKLSLDGQVEVYQIEALLEFSNDRKRMSIIVSHQTTGQLTMYTKGADSHMLPACTNDYPDAPPLPGETATDWRVIVADELSHMAGEGLRTLVMAMKPLSVDDFIHWKAVYDEASLAMGGLRQVQISAACVAVEQQMRLLGCSGVEDKLQDCVPETISFFLKSGVTIWMLTGDKRETAVNIAQAANLVGSGDKVIHLDAGGDVQQCLQDLSHTQCIIGNMPHSKDGKASVVIVVDGHTFATIKAAHWKQFFSIATCIKSAVCCRLTPLQKASIVEMFQQGNQNICMGIGDGANDVSMIQEARVGVGIMGLEGSQAELASDFAIPRFKHLIRLCAVHGRFACVRNAYLIQHSFYKNNVFASMQAFFAFYNGFTGQTIFDDWIIASMNLLFTQLPPFLAGIIEKDMDDSVVERDPLLYQSARFEAGFNEMSGSLWMLSALVHSTVIYYFCLPTLWRDDMAYHQTSGLFAGGNMLMSVVVAMVLGKACIHLNCWNWIMVMTIILSVIVYVGFVAIYSIIGPVVLGSSRFYGLAHILVWDIKFWAYFVFFIAGWLVATDYAFMYMQRMHLPTYSDIVRQKLSRTNRSMSRPPVTYALLVVAPMFALLVTCFYLAFA